MDELVARIGRRFDVEAAYLYGSAATGAFDPERSDLDVIAVTPRPLAEEEKQAVVDEANALPCPARSLDLAVYARGRDRYELNLIKDEFVSFDAAADPSWWYVLERATAETHSVALVGPPWAEVFAPVPREEILDAIEQAVDESSLPNLCRSWCWLETGEWVTKPEAAQWLRDKVRAAVEAAR